MKKRYLAGLRAAWRAPLCAPRQGAQLIALAAVVLLALSVAWAEGGEIPAAATARTLLQPVPLLAYYDLASGSPSLQESELNHQITLARHAGFDGFLVGWSPTVRYDQDLTSLVHACDARRFGLGIVLGGSSLAAGMQPDRAQTALRYLSRTFVRPRAFDLYAHPLVIWNGSWRYSPDQIADVAGPYRSRFLVLAADASPVDYRRISASVAGDAFLQPNMDPMTGGYNARLDRLSAAVHASGGLWLAPAFPGLGSGGLQVPRRDGATLRRAMDAAVRSSPDAVVVLSWNSRDGTSVATTGRAGAGSLDVLADIHQAVPPQAGAELDTSLPGTTSGDTGRYTLPVLAATALFTVLAFALVVRRALHSRDGE